MQNTQSTPKSANARYTRMLSSALNLMLLAFLVGYIGWHIHLLWFLPLVGIWLAWIYAAGICRQPAVYPLGCIACLSGTTLIALASGDNHRWGAALFFAGTGALWIPYLWKRLPKRTAE